MQLLYENSPAFKWMHSMEEFVEYSHLKTKKVLVTFLRGSKNMHFSRNIRVTEIYKTKTFRNQNANFTIFLLLQNFNILNRKKRNFSGFFRARGSFVEKCPYF